MERKHFDNYPDNNYAEESDMTVERQSAVQATLVSSDHEQPQVVGQISIQKLREDFTAENDEGECSAETIEQAAIETLVSLDHELPVMLVRLGNTHTSALSRKHLRSPESDVALVTAEQSSPQTLVLSDIDKPELTTVVADQGSTKKLLLLSQHGREQSSYSGSNGERPVVATEQLATSDTPVPSTEAQSVSADHNQLESNVIVGRRNSPKFAGKHRPQAGTQRVIVTEVNAMPHSVVNLDHIYPQSAAGQRNAPQRRDCSEATSKPATSSTGEHAPRQHYCPHCELACTSLASLSRHVRTHFGITE